MGSLFEGPFMFTLNHCRSYPAHREISIFVPRKYHQFTNCKLPTCTSSHSSRFRVKKINKNNKNNKNYFVLFRRNYHVLALKRDGSEISSRTTLSHSRGISFCAWILCSIAGEHFEGVECIPFFFHLCFFLYFY